VLEENRALVHVTSHCSALLRVLRFPAFSVPTSPDRIWPFPGLLLSVPSLLLVFFVSRSVDLDLS